MLCLRVFFVFVTIFVCVNSQMNPFPVVDTSVGPVSGIKGADFTAFLGIPYGFVDEKNPFAAATYAPNLNTTYLAYKDPVICPQLVHDVPEGNIHCLNLNIYRPNNVTTNNSLPVMVFIHGGAFVEGDGNLKTYSPKFLVRNNVIIVTVNYRLGVYGFLCIPELNYSNQGLKDQLLAFEWVKNNIEYFGGNNSDITIFGHSAGSVSVDLHLLFDEKKVFNKVILQSGSAVSPIVINNSANKNYVRRVAESLGFNVKDQKIDDIMKKLANLDTNTLINMTGRDIFRPCIDEIYIKKQAKVNLKGIKVMIGCTQREGLFFYNNNEPTSQFFIYVPSQSLVEVKNYYLNGSNIIDDVIEFGTDFMFNYPIERSLRYYVGNADAVYVYKFSYDGKRNFIKLRDNITGSGATHGDELGYLFDADFLGNQIAKEDHVVIESITTWWTNFAKYGYPDGSWPPTDRVSKFYMNIGTPISTGTNFFKDKIEFWDNFYSKYGGCVFGIDYGEEYKCMKNNAAMFNFNAVFALMFILQFVRAVNFSGLEAD